MHELTNDPFYEMIKTYDRCIIDYCLIENDTSYDGYRSHKDAVLFAMRKTMERYVDYQLEADPGLRKDRPDDELFTWSFDIENAKAKCIDSPSFLYVPNVIKKEKCGKVHYDCELSDTASGRSIPYWYAFLNTPHGTGYGPEDFNKVNEVLFPNGAQSLEVYEWTTDWSEYFDDGHEWWGAACFSAYDRTADRFVVLMASTTD